MMETMKALMTIANVARFFALLLATRLALKIATDFFGPQSADELDA